MDDMRISFIIPLYNEEKGIALCLDSIITEMHEGDEIIVVDNGSTDNSISIAATYEKVRLLEKPGITIGALRNTGAMCATGDILAFIDADCILSNNWRKHVLATLESVSVAATGSKVDLPEDACWLEKAWCSQRKILAGQSNYINSGNFVIWKSIFIDSGRFDENLITGEDSEFCWRLKKQGYVIYENPAIKVRHLDNPKNLRDFYKQQRWHGLGMFGTFEISWFDKPVIMTLFYVFCIFAGLVLLVGYGKLWGESSLWLAITSIFLVPVVTSFYRCFQYKNFRYLPQFVLLYLVFFSARADSLWRICYRATVEFVAKKKSV